MTFKWTPACGIDARNVQRLEALFPRPKQVMGEAWFLGQRRIFDELADDPSELSFTVIEEVFGEVISGIRSFGTYDEWVDWAHYLVPRLACRANEYRLAAMGEYLIGAVLQISLSSCADDRYETYSADILNTLGSTLMEAENWENGQVKLGRILHRNNNNPAQYWGWDKASGDLSASMFLCLRFVKADDMETWVKSIFSISCPIWRIQILVWYLGWENNKSAFPSAFDGSKPSLEWQWSHSISGFHGEGCVADVIISEAKVLAFDDAFLRCLDALDLRKLREELKARPFVWAEVASLFVRVQKLRDQRDEIR